MKILLCLDCDGTLYPEESLIPPVKVAQKPIPLSRLDELEVAGIQLVNVLPSSACDHLPYSRITHPDRVQVLREAAERYPSDFYIYLSDNVADVGPKRENDDSNWDKTE